MIFLGDYRGGNRFLSFLFFLFYFVYLICKNLVKKVVKTLVQMYHPADGLPLV